MDLFESLKQGAETIRDSHEPGDEKFTEINNDLIRVEFLQEQFLRNVCREYDSALKTAVKDIADTCETNKEAETDLPRAKRSCMEFFKKKKAPKEAEDKPNWKKLAKKPHNLCESKHQGLKETSALLQEYCEEKQIPAAGAGPKHAMKRRR